MRLVYTALLLALVTYIMQYNIIIHYTLTRQMRVRNEVNNPVRVVASRPVGPIFPQYNVQKSAFVTTQSGRK